MFCQVPDFDKLTSAHFFGWKGKLKTGMYYLKTQPAVDPISFGLDIDDINRIESKRGIVKVKKVGRAKKEVKKEVAKPNSIISCDSCAG
jgi:hypothetical protein